MRLGSLCSGYGGLEAGIGQVLDIEPVWCSEIDKDASKVLATHHPNVPNLGDLTVLDWHQVEPVDIICAGFPCQPFSHAGKRQGEDDDRAIFSYIAEAISVLRPRLVVLENVAAITTLGGPGVIAALARVGYDCRWGIVRASDTGAPHRRARWFCIAEPADADSKQREGIRDTTRLGRRPDGCAAADAGGERHGPRQNHLLVGRLDGQDRRAWGQSRHRDETPAADADEPGGEAWADTGPERERIRQQPVGSAAPAADFGPYDEAVRRWEYIIGRPAPDPTDDRGLRPEFVEWMMGLPEGWVCNVGLSRTAALKMLGNGVVPQQAALAVDLLL